MCRAMKTTSEFLDELLGPSDCQTELPNGRWVNARPLEFSHGVATAGFWREMRRRAADAWQVLRGRADAVEKR